MGFSKPSMNGDIFRLFPSGRKRWIPAFAGAVMFLKAQPGNESPVT